MCREVTQGFQMTMFPQLSDTYYTDNDHNILKLMDYTYAKNITINQSFWSEADVDSRFEAGDQTLWNDIYGNLPAFRRRQFNFNRIKRIINMVTGYQRQHRKSTIVTAVEGASDQTASQFTKILYNLNNSNGILETISDAFHGACITGMNLLSVSMDYSKDPVNGDIQVNNNAYNSFLIDPYFKKMDLSDCNNVWSRKYVSRAQAKALLPGREKEIDSMKGWGNRDGKFQFMPEAYNYGMQDLLIYDEFWYLDTRNQKMLIDTQTGECMEWKGSDKDLKEYTSMYRQIMVVDNLVPTCKLAIVVQGKVMYHGLNPLNTDKYPFVPLFAYYLPQIPYFPWRIQGITRGLRDSQYLYNRRRIIELDILESQMTSGFIYKEDALVNPKDVFMQGQGRGLAIKSEASIDDVRRIDPPQVPPSMIQLSQLLANEVNEISGVNEELLGAAKDDQSGILSMLRQGAGLTTLQILFDHLDQAQKLLGNVCVELIQNNYTPGKVRRIIQEEPSPEFYNRAFMKYDAAVEEGLNTTTQKQMQFAQLLQLKQMGLPIPSDQLLEASSLQNKDKLIKSLAMQEQMQQQQAQQQVQLQAQVLQSQIQDTQARAMANQGLGMERISRMEENRALAVERMAEAQKDRDMGVYERIRAAKELTDIDLKQLEKALNLIKILQEQSTDLTPKEALKPSVSPVQSEMPTQPQPSYDLSSI